MPSYCSVSDLKTYLSITTSTDDTLLQLMLDAATARIDSKCGRTFQAASDAVRYFDPSIDLNDNNIELDADLSYITSVLNGTDDITTSIYHLPRNVTPYYQLGLRSDATSIWSFSIPTEEAITVTGR